MMDQAVNITSRTRIRRGQCYSYEHNDCVCLNSSSPGLLYHVDTLLKDVF